MQDMRNMIQAVLASRLEQILGEEVEAAKLKVEQRLRAEIAQAALSVASHYSVEMRGNEVVLRVENRQ